jgi:hypothetical protein
LQDVVSRLPELKLFAGPNVVEDNFRRTEQHFVDLVKVSIKPFEDLEEWSAEIG